MHRTTIPLGPNGGIETSLILRHTRVWIRQVFDQELRGLLIFLLGDDDVAVGEIFSLGGEKTGFGDEELGVGFALLEAFAGP